MPAESDAGWRLEMMPRRYRFLRGTPLVLPAQQRAVPDVGRLLDAIRVLDCLEAKPRRAVPVRNRLDDLPREEEELPVRRIERNGDWSVAAPKGDPEARRGVDEQDRLCRDRDREELRGVISELPRTLARRSSGDRHGCRGYLPSSARSIFSSDSATVPASSPRSSKVNASRLGTPTRARAMRSAKDCASALVLSVTVVSELG